MSIKPVTIVKSDYTCSICCENFNESVKIKVLSCKHNLCTVCFKKHSDVSNVCPFCRRNIYKPIATKKKAFSKTILSMGNAINSTQLIKSLNKTTPINDQERLKLKLLFSQLKQNMIDLSLIVDDSFPVSSNILNLNNNFYLGDFQEEEEEEDELDDEETDVNVNIIRDSSTIMNSSPALFSEILSFMMSATITSTTSSNTQDNEQDNEQYNETS